MDNSTESNWRKISKAYAGENLELGSKDLEVYIPEFSGFTDGEITSDLVPINTDGEDHEGTPYAVEVLTSNTIAATWRQNGSNRITPPDIRRGEAVDIWQYGTVDKFYWSPSGDTDNLRRLETVTWAFSNTQDEDTEELDENNSYNFQVSTHQKVVSFNTSNSDGEPYTHHIQIDTKNGNMHYRDSKGNYIQVEAESNRIIMENASGSKADVHGEDISITAPNNINLKCTNLNIEAQSITETVSTKSTEASTISETATSKDIQSPVNVTGNVSVTGGMGVSGNSTVRGNIESHGTLTNNGKDVGSTHRHGGVDTGNGSTSTPH